MLAPGASAAGRTAPQERDIAPWPLMAAGESLTSKPFRGKDRKGHWIDASDGSGRAGHVNGGLGLDSPMGARGGPGDHGTTSVILEGNPQKYGRWEVRLRSWWTFTKKKVALADVSHNYAVEVARDHITWFLDGRAIATVKNRTAISGVPLTLRLSLQGDGKKEMNRTRARFDWMRAWPIDTGRRVTNGNRMKVGTHNATC